MPQIKDYMPQESAAAPLPGRSPERLFATPEAFGGGEAAGLGDLGQGLQEAGNTLYKVAQEQEVTQAAVQIAQTRQQMTTYLDKSMQTADPNDPHFADKFSQTLADNMSAMGDNYNTVGGQDAFARGKADLTGELLGKAQQYQISMAGEAAKQNYLTTLDANRSTLVSDPTQFQSIINSNKAMLNDPNGVYARIEPKARLELDRTSNEQLALSAVEGLARANPQLAKSSIESGQWDQYVSGNNRGQLDNIANRMLMAQEVDQNRAIAYQGKVQRQQEKNTEDGFVQQLVADPTKLSASQIATSNLSPEQKLKWIDPSNGILTRALGQKDNSTYGPGFVNALQSIHEPDGTPGKITSDAQISAMLTPNGQAAGPANITVSGYEKLRTELDSRTTQAGRAESDMKSTFLSTAKAQIVGIVSTPSGQAKYDQFINNFFPAYQAGRDAGKTPQQLLGDGPDSLMSMVGQFKRSQNQQLLDVTRAGVAPSGPQVPVAGSGAGSAAAIPQVPASALVPGGTTVPDSDGIKLPGPPPPDQIQLIPNGRTAYDKNGIPFYESAPGVFINSKGEKYGGK